MLNFNDKELVIPGIGINIISITQFKVLNAFALKSSQKRYGK